VLRSAKDNTSCRQTMYAHTYHASLYRVIASIVCTAGVFYFAPQGYAQRDEINTKCRRIKQHKTIVSITL